MNARILRSKPFQATVAVMLAAMFVLAGTFAWNSFNQSRTNVFKELVAPDVNLHDDFEGGPNKDVYVENSGQKNIFVRVRLTEYLETINRLSMVEGHVRDEAQAHNWAPHNGVLGGNTALDNCTLPAGTVTAAAWGTDTFHTYYSWIMGGKGNAGGEIFYKPATPEQKGEYTTDANGNQITVKAPEVVSDPLTANDPQTGKEGDAHLEYKAQVEALMATGLDEAAAMTQLGIKKTLTAKVVSMKDWLDDGGEVQKYQTGDFWVIDEADGWCYWANALPGGKATGLLLDKVDRNIDKQFDSNAEYCINVWLQAVDEGDLGQFSATGNGGITDNGKKLMGLATGNMVIDTNGATYTKNADGSYLQLTNADGTAPTDPKKFIILGVDNEGKPNGINAAATNRIELDSYFTITDLVWNGTAYDNYGDFTIAPFYNIAKGPGTVPTANNYKLTGMQRGADGNYYLVATASKSDGSNGFTDGGDVIYLGSVLKETTTTYKQGAPGAGPFGQIYLNGGSLGGKENLRHDPKVTFTTRSFTHLANGVYLESTGEGRAATTYFFAGKILEKAEITTAINGATGDAAEKEAAAIKAVFPLQLTVGSEYWVKYDEAITEVGAENGKQYVNEITTTTPTDTTNYIKYTMSELVKGANGNYYFELDKAKPRTGYIGVGKDNYLGNGSTGAGTGADIRTWAGDFGIGSGDIFVNPGDFNESFLKGKSSSDLAVGKTIALDGNNWIVTGTDKYGNRLLVTEEYLVGTNGSNPYMGSPTEARARAFYNGSMPTLKPYVIGATTPVELVFDLTRATPDSNAVTNAIFDKTGAKTFVPSQSEWMEYDIWKKLPYQSGGGILQTRSPGRSAGKFISIQHTGTANGGKFEFIDSRAGAPGIVLACWVRLSDADRIATATEDEMNQWKTMPTVGAAVQFGSYPQDQAAATPKQPLEWKVLKVDGTRALMVTTKLVEAKRIGPGQTAPVTTWNGSEVKTAMDAFYNTAFSAAEKEQILYTKVEDNETAISMPAASGSKVFTMTVNEYKQLKPTLNVPLTVYAQSKIVSPTLNNWYWTRSVISNYQYCYSSRDSNFQAGAANAVLGLRPAIWVDYSK